MRRRDFISALAAAAAWTGRARAQQPATPVIGLLGASAPTGYATYLAALRQGLDAGGYVEGRNVAIEYRWADSDYDRLPGMAADLVARRVGVIVTAGGDPPALAAKARTHVVPIVFETGFDPVKLGLVASLNRPGGNVTGVSFLSVELEPKRLEQLAEVVPAAQLALLVNPNNQSTSARMAAIQSAARASGRQLVVFAAGNDAEIESAFAAMASQNVAGLVVAGDAFFRSNIKRLVALAARHGIPASYNSREFAEAGGLMSYGTSLTAVYRQVGLYAARILNGEKPGDLPVVQSTTVELVVNVKAAKAIGLELPPALLVRADEVIE